MKKKKEAFLLEDNIGLTMSAVSTKEDAYEAFKEYCRTDFPDIAIDPDKVFLMSYWYCRKCSYYTGEEPLCGECGKDFNSCGRKLYTYHF